MPAQPVDRLSADDLMSLHGDAGTVPMQVGGILWLESGRARPGELLGHLEARLPAAPRLRRRMQWVQPGCGRPVWVDDVRFRLGDHVSTVAVGDDAAVAALATSVLTDPLPLDRPPWAARLAVRPDGTVRALILVVHHVLADGMAALAVLAGLTDGPAPPPAAFPRPTPDRRELVTDNLRGRLAGVRRLPSALLEVVMAVRLLVASGTVRASSLNRPTGTSRAFVTVTRDLAAIRDAAHACGGSVNDAALAVVAGALRRVLVQRGEDASRFVFSVPFAYHAPGTATGNASAVMPLAVPAAGTLPERVAATARVTRAAKRRPRALGNSILRPAFRLMVGLGWFRRFIDNQRQVNTIVTNVRGPAERLTLAGCPVEQIVPLTVATGNITVAFAIFSYAGRLSVTAMADPGTCPDLDAIADALGREWDALLSSQAVS